jgi:hypothetical protein
MAPTFYAPHRFTVVCGNRSVSLYARNESQAAIKGGHLIQRTAAACSVWSH